MGHRQRNQEGCSCNCKGCLQGGEDSWPWHQEGGSCDWPCHQESGSSYRPRYQEGGPCSWSHGQEGRSRSEDGDLHCVQLQHGQADCRCHQACRQDFLEVGEEERRSHEGGQQEDISCIQGDRQCDQACSCFDCQWGQGGWPVVLEGSQACSSCDRSCDRHRGQEGWPCRQVDLAQGQEGWQVEQGEGQEGCQAHRQGDWLRTGQGRKGDGR